MAEGRAALTLQGASCSEIVLRLTARVDRAFLARAGRHLRRLLERTPSTLTLDIGSWRDRDGRPLARLLRTLARYGDRVHIIADESLRQRIPVDWSRFRMVLRAAA